MADAADAARQMDVAGTSAPVHLPYPPSWLDRLTDRVDRLPGPAWAYYVGFGLVLLLAQIVVKWSDGTYAGGFVFYHIIYAGTPANLLWSLHYVDRVAAQAFDSYRPAMNADDAQAREYRYRLTTMPALPALIATLLGAIWGLMPWNAFLPEEAQVLGLYTSTAGTILDRVTSVLGWSLAGLFIYHTIHQLRIVSRLLARYSNINIFKLAPLYAFSRLTGVTAVGLTIGFYLFNSFNLALPEGTGINTGTIINTTLFTLVAIITFVLPLWGVHRLLQREKERLQGESADRLQGLLQELHRRVEARDTKGAPEYKNLLDSALAERDLLAKLPTWPWQGETVRLVGTALVLPIVLFIIQQVLERLLGL
jgi:hypothetical protein